MPSGHPNPSPATRFKPGKSGNLAGRPKGLTITSALREVLAEMDPKTREELRKSVARSMVKQALRGNVQAAQFIADRAEGKIRDVLQVEAVSRLPDLSDKQIADRLLLGQDKILSTPDQDRAREDGG